MGTREGKVFYFLCKNKFRDRKDREGLCVSKVHGDRVNNQYSSIYELNTYG